MENRELTIDDLASPVGEEMQSEVQPAMSYFAEGGEVEQGLFSQRIPQRPQMQQAMPQQRLKRTAAEMLQRMPQAQLGTMRFTPLNMPGIAGRPIQQFAEGGAVGGMPFEQRKIIDEQLDKGAPVENLFGANLTVPGPTPLPSFETNIPEFTPEYTPPTGPVNLTGSTDTTLKTFPTGLGDKAPTFTFAGTQQATVPTTAKSLYEQISPSSLAAGPYDFRMATGTLPDTSTGAKPGATLGTALYTPTEQTFTKPTLLSEEEARLKQPVLTRYEPDIKFGGLTTYLGPLQTSPYKDTDTGGGTTGGGTTGGGATTAGDWKTYGFTAPKEGATYSEKPTYWFNRQLGLFVETPTGGFIPPPTSAEGGKWEIGGFYQPPEDTLTGGEGNDTLTGGEGVDWTNPSLFPTGNFTEVEAFTREKPTTLEDIFKVYGGVDLDAKTANLYKNAKFGWDKATDSFAITPTSTAAILSSKTFKNNAGKTVDNMLSELGYTVGGKTDTATNVSAAKRNEYIAALATGTMDITRLANTLTKELRSAGVFRLSPTMQTFNRIYSQYAPAATGGEGTDATTKLIERPLEGRPAGSAGPQYPNFPRSMGGTKDLGVVKPPVVTPPSKAASAIERTGATRTRGALLSTTKPKTKAEGSGPEGEYADPVAAIRERQRARRESGTMDQGSARAQLKKFFGGEDLTPEGYAHGGLVHRAEGSPVTAEGYVLEPTFGERMGANVSDFLMNVGIKGADLLPVDKSKMSAAHRLYLDTFGVKENRAPVTKEYFNQEEMDALSDLISRKGGTKGSMTYNDYKKFLKDRPIKEYSLTSGQLDPYVSISKSLGQFNYEYDPKTKSYKIIDEYDFNPLPSKSGIRSDSDFIGDYISEDDDLIDKLRLYAGRKLPPGTGRKVDLSVPVKKPVKRADGSPVYGEMPDTGGITPDTIAALLNKREVNAREEKVKKPATTNEPTTPGMFSQASKLLKNLTSSAPADTTLNMDPYESLYVIKDVGSPEKGRKGAFNVYSALLPKLMRTRFPEYVAFSPATVTKEAPRGRNNAGEFDVFYRTIALDPSGINSILMDPYGKYGYIGAGGYETTTEDTLNALRTLLHESMHARTRGAKGQSLARPHPADQLKKLMPSDRFDEMIREIRISDLPSVGAAASPVEVINEYFATATPVKQMAEKNMITKRSSRELKKIERLASKYPELEKMRMDWERPELFFKD